MTCIVVLVLCPHKKVRWMVWLAFLTEGTKIPVSVRDLLCDKNSKNFLFRPCFMRFCV